MAAVIIFSVSFFTEPLFFQLRKQPPCLYTLFQTENTNRFSKNRILRNWEVFTNSYIYVQWSKGSNRTQYLSL